jgi:hypothetical protein
MNSYVLTDAFPRFLRQEALQLQSARGELQAFHFSGDFSVVLEGARLRLPHRVAVNPYPGSRVLSILLR